MINGHMAEAQRGFVVLEEVEGGTIARFAEWVYRGYYTAADFEIEASGPSLPVSSSAECATTWSTGKNPIADPTPVPEHNFDTASPDFPSAPLVFPPAPLDFPSDALTDVIEPPTSHNHDGVWGAWDTQRPEPSRVTKPSKGTKKIKSSKGGVMTEAMEHSEKRRQALKNSFKQRKYTVRQGTISILPPRANEGENEDYTKVFLCHAHVYVFAEKYDIQLLKILALEELHYTLARYTLYPRRTGDIVALLRYVYDDKNVGDGDDLRKMLNEYVEYEISLIMKNDGFHDLMTGGSGQLLRDFMKMVAKWID